jgi:hypothetical protein
MRKIQTDSKMPKNDIKRLKKNKKTQKGGTKRWHEQTEEPKRWHEHK